MRSEETFDPSDPVLKYDPVGTLVLYIFRFIALPQYLLNFLGLTIYNAFRDGVTLKYGPSVAPFICIRFVTRSDHPDLVKRNVDRNLKICLKVGLENFIIEVVTDKAINLPQAEAKLR